MKIRMRYIFKGRVQGVGFRYTACRQAEHLGLTGWVRNENNGSVTVEVQGERGTIGTFLEMLENGRFIRIESISAVEIPVDDEDDVFEPVGY